MKTQSIPSNPRHLVILDASIERPEALLAGLVPEAEAIVLDGDRDGILQISEILQPVRDLRELHLVSHGHPGAIALGNAELNGDSLPQYAPLIGRWRRALNPDARVLLYGCAIAAQPQGQLLLDRLHHLLDRDLCAATAPVGGNGRPWRLDVCTRHRPPVPLAFRDEVMAAYPVSLGKDNRVYGVDGNQNIRIVNLQDGTSEIVGQTAFPTYTLARYDDPNEPDDLGNLYYIGLETDGSASVAYWNPDSGENKTLPQPTGVSTGNRRFTKLGQTVDGTLYAMEGKTLNLYEIDSTTGTAVQVGVLAGNGILAGGGDLAFDPNNPRQMYVAVSNTTEAGVTSQKLYTVNLDNFTTDASGLKEFEATYVGDTGLPRSGSLAFGENGNIYTTIEDNGTHQLYQLDPSTAEPTFVANIGGNVSFNDFASLPTPTPLLDLVASKTDGVTEIEVGDTITYTITVGNETDADDNVANTGIRVLDTVHASIADVAWRAVIEGEGSFETPADQAGTGNEIDSSLTLEPGAIATYTITGQVTSAVEGNLENTAIVMPPPGVNLENPSPGDPLDSLQVTDDDTQVNGGTDDDTQGGGDDDTGVDLQVTKTDSVSNAAAGSKVTYTIEVSNPSGSDLSGVNIADDLPDVLEDVTWTSLSSDGSEASGTGDIDESVTLPAGASITYTVEAWLALDATVGSNLSNTATVEPSGSLPDTNPDNNTATDDDTEILPASAEIRLSKTDGLTTIAPGEAIAYTLEVANDGPSRVQSLVLSEDLPSELTDVSFDTGGDGSYNAKTGNWTGFNLEPGQIVTLTVSGTIADDVEIGTTIRNAATVTLPNGIDDPNADNNEATDENTVISETTAQSDLSLRKTDNLEVAAPGDRLTYTIDVTHSGTTVLEQVFLQEDLPEQLEDIEFEPSVGTYNPKTGAWTGLSLDDGDTITLDVSGTVSESATGTLVNQASVLLPVGVSDPDEANNQAEDSTTIAASSSSSDSSGSSGGGSSPSPSSSSSDSSSDFDLDFDVNLDRDPQGGIGIPGAPGSSTQERDRSCCPPVPDAPQTIALGETVVSMPVPEARTWSALTATQTTMGSEANDAITGDDRDDAIHGIGGNDSLRGEGGNDRLQGGKGGPTSADDADRDLIAGNTGSDILSGNGGDDTIFGGQQDDLILAGKDNDAAWGDRGHDVLHGDLGDDTLAGDERQPGAFADPGRDWLDGGDGDDWLFGNANADTILGGTGDDAVYGGRDDDWLAGGEGRDAMSGDLGDDTLVGSDDRHNANPEDGDRFYGNGGSDRIIGSGGSDTVHGGRDDDRILGGADDDMLWGDLGSDTISGDTGDDVLVGRSQTPGLADLDGRDRLDGGHGHDAIAGNESDDTLRGETGDDTLLGGQHSDLLDGGDGNDWLSGDLGNDAMRGGAGNDTIAGGAAVGVADLDGRDLAFGDGGDDLLAGNPAADSLAGGDGNDTVLGGRDDDLLWGEAGNDLLKGDRGSDTLCGGDGDDTLIGANSSLGRDGDGDDLLCTGTGDDIALGNQGDDTLSGGDGNDSLYGGSGDDTILGGDGDDWLSGDRGNDLLDGGAGRDRFLLSDGTGQVTIADFEVNADLLMFGGDLSNRTVSLMGRGDDTQVMWNGNVVATLVDVEPMSVKALSLLNHTP